MGEPYQDPLIEEALHWLVVLKDRNASAADREAFDQWLMLDPSHGDAWRRAQLVWTRLDRIGPAFRRRPQAPRSPGPSRWVATPTMRPPFVSAPMRAGRRRFLYGAGAVAALAMPATLVAMRGRVFATHATRAGERRTIVVEDGSAIELAGATSLSVDFTGDLRRILLQEGEAAFDVVPDPARPFEVHAASGYTRALGTAFDVKMSDGLVTVAATDQSVRVSANDAEPVTVNEGQLVRYGPNRTGTVRDADLDQVEAWRRDRLVFQDAPLGEVIDDLERYRGGRIVLLDSRLRALSVTGSYATSEADAVLDALANSLPVRVIRVSGLLVVVSSRTQGARQRNLPAER